MRHYAQYNSGGVLIAIGTGPGGIEITGGIIVGEHTGGLAHAHGVLSCEQEVDLAGQGGEPGDFGQMFLAI